MYVCGLSSRFALVNPSWASHLKATLMSDMKKVHDAGLARWFTSTADARAAASVLSAPVLPSANLQEGLTDPLIGNDLHRHYYAECRAIRLGRLTFLYV